MEVLSNTAIAVLSILGLVLIVLGIVIPYFIYQINCELKEIRKEVNNLQNIMPSEPDSRSSWRKKTNWK